MYCKLEGKEIYVPYGLLPKKDQDLSKIVEIKFKDLVGEQFKKAAESVEWRKLTKLRKIEGVDSDLNSYTFPKKTFSNLEEIKFTKCGLSAETLNSLLDAVPNIETAQNFKFAWDVPSSISTADLFDDNEAFQLASERIRIIQIAQKKHDKNSGETTVLDEYSVVGTYLKNSEDEEYLDDSSLNSGTSYSDSEHLEVKVVKINSTKADIPRDDAAESSVQVTRVSGKKPTQQQDDGTLSTLFGGLDMPHEHSRVIDGQSWEYLQQEDGDFGDDESLEIYLEDGLSSTIAANGSHSTSPSPSRDSGHTIECFIKGRGLVDYAGLSSPQKRTVTGIRLTGKRPDADATNAVDWSQFPNLTYLGIVNSTITVLESSRENRMLFPNMEEIKMDDCCVTSDAVMSFWAYSGESIKEIIVTDPRNSQGVLIKGQERAYFERMVGVADAIQVEFPPPPPSLTDDEHELRSSSKFLREDHPGMGFSDPGSSLNGRNKASRTQQDRGAGYTGAAVDKGRQVMYSDGSNSSDSRTPGSSRRATIYSEDGAHNRTQPGSRGPGSTGVAAGAATNRASLFPPTHVNHRTTGGRVAPSVHTAGTTTGNVHGRYSEFISQASELVVGNESENSRNYEELVHDTAVALDLIKREKSCDRNNYRLFVNKDGQTTSITYQNRDHMATPILDASIDTVIVHRGWQKVDKKIPNEARARIVIASLGIPPCPPDIHISDEESKLGRAIRKEFNKLKSEDDPYITVTRVSF